MADIDLKTETPDATLPSTGFLFGADSQAAASPSVYSTQAVATALLGSTSLTGATVTTSQPVLDLTQTWNASGVTFTGLKANFTDTASAAGSLLMELQTNTGGAPTTRFSVSKSGGIIATGSITAGAYNSQNNLIGTSSNAAAAGSYLVSTGTLRLNDGGANGSFGASTWKWPSVALVGWVSTSDGNGQALDTILTRRGAANLRLGAADAGAVSATVTITIASPGVVTWSNHTLSTGTPVVFTTTGALPTGITAGTTYYVIFVDNSTFQIATSFANALAGTAVNTSGSQSGTHTGTRNAIVQRLSAQGVTGVTDRPGADLLITGSQGTGTGAGGSIIFQVAPAGSSGTAQNALQTVLQITGAGGLTGQDGATANTLALRNSTNAQLFNIYKSYTDASNYERLAIGYSAGAGAFIIQRQNAGTGVAYGLLVQGGSQVLGVGIAASGAVSWTIASGNHLLAGVDNTYDIGASGATRPRNVYVAGGVFVGGGIEVQSYISTNDVIRRTSRFVFRPQADGVATLTNWAENDWGRLQFGGTTSSFPALKRSSTVLQSRLADDSDFAPLQGQLRTHNAYTAGAPTATGYIVLYDSTGTAYKVPAEAL